MDTEKQAEIYKKINLGKIIEAGLKRKGISKTKFADYFGVGKSTVTLWCQNKIIPPGDKLLAIIILLDLYHDLFPDFLAERKNTSISREEFSNLATEYSVLKLAFSELKRKLDEIQLQKVPAHSV